MKQYIILGIVSVLLVGGAIALLVSQNSSESNSSSSDNSTPALVIDSANLDAGSYKDYSAETLSAQKDDQRTVLFFHASWCPACKGTDKDIKENEESIAKGVTILKADFDSETELKQEYGITSQHSFVLVDKNGKKIKSTTGLSTLNDIEKFAIGEVSNDSMDMTVSTDMMDTADVKTVSYETYSKDAVNSLPDTQNIVLFFNASWCPACQSTNKSIESNKDIIPSNVSILSVDYDDNQDLRQKFGVTSQHTFVKVTNDLESVSKTTGLEDVEEVIEFAVK